MKRKLVTVYWLILGLFAACSEFANSAGVPLFSLPDMAKPEYESHLKEDISNATSEFFEKNGDEITYNEEALEKFMKDLLEEPLFENESTKVETTLHGVSLIRVVDGDTIVISDNGIERKVRMIGIDAPESVHEDEAKNSIYGDFASEYTKNLLSDLDKVYLQYDIDATDDFERTLAYVWLTDDVEVYDKGDINTYMVNAILLEKGYAFAKTYEPNILYSEYFSEICNNAIESDTGLWKYEEFEQIW